MKFGEGSSDFFAVTLVIFEEVAEAERMLRRIDQLRVDLHLPSGYEFHFFRNNVSVRRAFLNAVKDGGFRYVALVADKRKLTGPEFRTRDDFYKAVCGAAFDGAKDLLREANVKFDEGGSKAAKKELAAYLKRKVNEAGGGEERIKKVGTQDSKTSSLIQLADMVCGAVHRGFQADPSAGEYRQLIKRREHLVLLWPAEESE